MQHSPCLFSFFITFSSYKFFWSFYDVGGSVHTQVEKGLWDRMGDPISKYVF